MDCIHISHLTSSSLVVVETAEEWRVFEIFFALLLSMSFPGHLQRC